MIKLIGFLSKAALLFFIAGNCHGIQRHHNRPSAYESL